MQLSIQYSHSFSMQRYKTKQIEIFVLGIATLYIFTMVYDKEHIGENLSTIELLNLIFLVFFFSPSCFVKCSLLESLHL